MRRVEKTIRYKKKFSLLDTLQYTLAIIITICFGIGLIPTYYFQISIVLIGCIIVQLILSLLRLRLLNVILEIIILILAILGIIPVLGYLFRFIGLFGALLEMASFKNYKMYKQIEIRTFDNFSAKKRKSNSKQIRKSNNKVVEADYKEK